MIAETAWAAKRGTLVLMVMKGNSSLKFHSQASLRREGGCFRP